jgi:hypothetical protein
MSAELRVYLDMLTAGEPHDGSYLEVRSKLPAGGMRQEFVPARAHRAARN